MTRTPYYHMLYIVDEYMGFAPHGHMDMQKLYRLVGNYYYQNALIFNYDSNRWNHNKEYMDYELNDLLDDVTPYVIKMKLVTESEPWAQGKDLVGFAIMPIDAQNYPGYSKGLIGPVADPDGTAIVGNVIWRDRKTRRLIPMCNKWTCGDRYQFPIETMNLGIAEFADTFNQVDLFRQCVARNNGIKLY